MRRSIVGLVLVVTGCVGTVVGAEPAPAVGVPGRAAQQRARALASELVAGVLDGQLRQLEENGLADRPLHADIASLRGNIDALVNGEMEEVVQVLARAESASGTERAALVQEARGTIRAIVARLSMERQRILRRLRIADIVAQARRLLERQRGVAETTTGLSTQPDGRREAVALKTLEDQRTIATLYEALTRTLDDVGGWGGEIGAGAVVGLRTLREHRVAPALAAAEERLGALDAAAARAEQRTVIEGLEALLATIEKAAGVQRADRAPAAEAARAVAEKAAAVRDDIASTPLDDAAIEKLLAEQAAVRDQLDALDQRLQDDPRIESLLEEAQEAALEATAGIFEARQEAAAAEENRVVAALEQIARQLESQPSAAPDMRSAEEFARQLADLQAAAAALEPIAAAQEAASREAPTSPQSAATQEQTVANALEAVSPDGQLPPAVEARLDTAAEAAAEAADALATAAPAAPDQAMQLAAEASAAVQAAQAEVARAAADAERAALAATVGELARAAEVAERAAATERAIAEAAQDLAASGSVAAATPAMTDPSDGAQPRQAPDDAQAGPQENGRPTMPSASPSAGQDQAGNDQAGNDQAGTDASIPEQSAADPAALVAMQEQVATVSAQLAEAVGTAVPEAADSLESAAPAMAKALDNLAALATHPPQAPAAAAAAAQESAAAAEALDAAAESLREAAAAAADRLAEVAAAQAQQAATSQPMADAPVGSTPSGAPQPADTASSEGSATPTSPEPPSAARAADLARDAELSREIAAAVQEQIAARADIAAASAALTTGADVDQSANTAPGDAQSPQAASRSSAAADLGAAEARFAEAQRTIGENVAEIVDQVEVGSDALRQALEMASQLGAAGDVPPPGGQSDGATPPAGTGAGAAASQTESTDAPAVPDGGADPTDLGTGFVPESPARTAEMIAGAEAHQAAAAAQPATAAQARVDESAGTTPGQETGRGSRPGEARGGPTAPLDGVGRDNTTPPGERSGDAAAGDRALEREAWFARLPPELRQAIRARGQRRAPRGYEEKLDRYFRTIDQ